MTPVGLTIFKSAERFGFSAATTGGHMARSMMLPELMQLFRVLPVETTKPQYRDAILDGNVLGKTTFSSREKSYRHLVQHYGLDSGTALFRVLRRLAAEEPPAIPLMAATCSYCRDAQLRVSFELVESLRSGALLTREQMEQHLEAAFPGRFKPAMKKSLAQNVNTTWTEAGHLSGRAKKVRAVPVPRVAASVYAMTAGYLLGLRGQTLVTSVFGRLVAPDASHITGHLALASGRGLVRFRQAGGIVEIDCSPLLTEAERTDQRQLELYGQN